MTLQYSRVLATANAAEDLCNQMAVLKSLLDQFGDYNADQAIDWTAVSTPPYITEEANGNLLGKPYSRQDVGTAVSTIAQLRNFFNNLAVTQGDHGGVINKLCRPLG